MAYRLQVSLRNPGNTPIHSVIYPGTIFEVADPFADVQNLAATEETSVTIPPGGSTVVEIDTWCLNQHLSAPSDTPMRLTGLRLARSYGSQYAVWDEMNSRR
jgi:hypothetical protein